MSDGQPQRWARQRVYTVAEAAVLLGLSKESMRRTASRWLDEGSPVVWGKEMAPHLPDTMLSAAKVNLRAQVRADERGERADLPPLERVTEMWLPVLDATAPVEIGTGAVERNAGRVDAFEVPSVQVELLRSEAFEERLARERAEGELLLAQLAEERRTVERLRGELAERDATVEGLVSTLQAQVRSRREATE